MARTFVRGIVPGLGALAVAPAAAVVLLVDVSATVSGTVPGDPVVAAATVLVLVVAAGLAGLTVVRVGQQEGTGWPARPPGPGVRRCAPRRYRWASPR